MLYFFSGLILTCIPFLISFCFSNKNQGFLNITTCVIIIHIITALSTQFFGIFNYSVILSIHIFFSFLSILIWLKYREPGNNLLIVVKLFSIKNLLIGGGVLLALGYFINIHYNYSGEVNTFLGIKQVVKDFYPYPIYSDEWVGLAFVRSIFEHQHLPIVNPLEGDKPFFNLLVTFHALTAHALMLFGAVPLIHYSILSIGIAFGVLVSIYVLLRQFKASTFIAIFGVLLVPLVVNTSTIPGLLFYLPFTLSFLVLLLSLIAIQLDSDKNYFLLSLCSFMLYPAMFVLIIPIGICNFWKNKKNLILASIIGVIATAVIVSLLLHSGFSLEEILRKILNLLVQSKSTKFQGVIGPWTMISTPLFLLSLVGLFQFWKKRLYPILTSCLVGLFLWFVESYTTHFFAIEHVRIIAITSLLLIIAAALGLNSIHSYLILRFNINRKVMNAILSLLIIPVIYFYSFNSWRKINIIIKNRNNLETVALAVSPINRYLLEEDLNLFKGIQHKKFLAPRWKSLVIGAATYNFPLDSKSSTVSMHLLDYNHFMHSSCEKKIKISQKYLIDYIYSAEFKCKGYNPMGSSLEGLFLYEFKL